MGQAVAKGLGEKSGVPGIGDSGERFENYGWGGIISSPMKDSASVHHLKSIKRGTGGNSSGADALGYRAAVPREMMNPLSFGSRRVGVLGGLEPPCSWLCLVEHSPAPPCSLILGVFGVGFRRVLVGLERGKVKQWSCPS